MVVGVVGEVDQGEQKLLCPCQSQFLDANAGYDPSCEVFVWQCRDSGDRQRVAPQCELVCVAVGSGGGCDHGMPYHRQHTWLYVPPLVPANNTTLLYQSDPQLYLH